MSGKWAPVAIAAAMAMAFILCSPGQAADLRQLQAPVMPPTDYNWTGFYAGANLGGAFDTEDVTVGTGELLSTDPSGVIGGLQFGYNYLFSPNWLLGIEGELEWTSAQGTGNFTTAVALGAGQVVSDHNWYDTVAGRLGYTLGPWLFYAKGGGAWMNADYHMVAQGFNTGMSAINTTRTGVTIGGGAEYMLSPRWSAKVEYAYFDFGTRSYNFTVPVFGPSTVHTRVNEVKFGMNYHWLPGMIMGGF
jgi:opacity protein-like surface antigen